MKISEAISMLEKAKASHGDVELYVDMDYGERPVELCKDELCPCPAIEEATQNMPRRLVI